MGEEIGVDGEVDGVARNADERRTTAPTKASGSCRTGNVAVERVDGARHAVNAPWRRCRGRSRGGAATRRRSRRVLRLPGDADGGRPDAGCWRRCPAPAGATAAPAAPGPGASAAPQPRCPARRRRPVRHRRGCGRARAASPPPAAGERVGLVVRRSRRLIHRRRRPCRWQAAIPRRPGRPVAAEAAPKRHQAFTPRSAVLAMRASCPSPVRQR